jgi:beta-lactamase regulating signal transducer with metallopeptidase domain
MSGIEDLWSMPVVRPVAWALLHFLWQGALVGMALAGALALLEKKSAALRYAVAVGALPILLALPVITVIRMTSAASIASAPAVSTVAVSAVSTPAASAPVLASPPTAGEAMLALILPGLFAFWTVGVALLSVWHLGGWTLTRRLRHRDVRPVPEPWPSVVGRLRRRLGIDRAVGLLESSRVSVPMVMGWLRPVILVPASALSGLSTQHLEAVLAHELAHVRRHDYLVNLFQAVVETLLFYHPAVWWVSSKVREEREHCCDDLAVSVCGDRLGYARALAELEGLRLPASPRFALAADGGSLVARIRRLVGAPAARSRGAWLAGVVALALIPIGAAVSVAPADEDAPRATAQGTEARESGQAPSHGTWMAEREKDGRISLSMRMKARGWGNWESTSTYSASEFSGPIEGQGVRFELRRDAGAFRFEGDFRGERGAGFFLFLPNAAYSSEMQRLGYEVPQDRLMELALHDVSLGFVREMAELGYTKESLDKLIEFRIHDVLPEFVREMAGLGYSQLAADRLVEFRIHDVDPAMVRALRDLGYTELPADRLVELSIHNVTPEFIREISEAGYSGVSADRLVEMRIHNVDTELIRKAQKRYGKLSADDLIEFSIRGELDREGE